MEEKGTIHIHLLTELTGNLYSEESEWEEDWSESDEYGMPLDGTELADYEEVIREELERYGEDDLMQYFDGSESIQEKIQTGICWNQVVCKGMAGSKRILLKIRL